ncbi:hypothetical protein IG631_13568 [Alternaria alternata]|jgi:hypothetical protein|nr:hypothetical protein IG631_13568 [Alternaria alternata]
MTHLWNHRAVAITNEGLDTGGMKAVAPHDGTHTLNRIATWMVGHVWGASVSGFRLL